MTVCRRYGSASSSGFPPRTDPDGIRERFRLPRSRRHVRGRGARSHATLDGIGLAARGNNARRRWDDGLCEVFDAAARAYQDDLNPVGGGRAFLEVLARELSSVLAVPASGMPWRRSQSAGRASGGRARGHGGEGDAVFAALHQSNPR